MKKITKAFFRYALVVLLTVGATTGIYLVKSNEEARLIRSGLEFARICIDTKELYDHVIVPLDNGMSGLAVAQTDEYLSIVSRLNQLSEAFPVDSKWMYVASKGYNSMSSRLSVLTISQSANDERTLPGYQYNMRAYPCMQEAINMTKEIVISGIVYDKYYNIWTRSGFIKLYHQGIEIGVLSVDLDPSELFRRIRSTILISFIFSMTIFLAVLQLGEGKWIMSKVERKAVDLVLQKKLDCEDKEKSKK